MEHPFLNTPPEPEDKGAMTAENLRDRAYFPALMAGHEVAAELVVSKSTGKRSAIVAVPVRADGRVVGALGVSIAMEKVAARIKDGLGLPGQVMFYALDDRHVVRLFAQGSEHVLERAAQGHVVTWC